MYHYILVRTFKKSSGFLTNPERVRRDEIRVIHRLSVHGTQCDEVEFHNCTSLVKYKYIPVHTGIYWYVLVHTSKTQQTSFDHASSSLWHLQVSDSQTTQARLSTAKVPQPSVDLVHVAATPAISSCRVVKGNIVNFFCNAVRKWRDNNDGILHTPQTVRKGITL